MKIKYMLLLIAILMISGCSKKIDESEENYTEVLQSSEWTGDKDWYYSEDGDLHGNYLGWDRYVMHVPSENSNERILGNNIQTNLVLESYKDKNGQIKRILYLEVFGNNGNINELTIYFDNGTPYKYTTQTKYNINIEFSEIDTPQIIEKLLQAKTFKINYTYKTARFSNKNFVKFFKIK